MTAVHIGKIKAGFIGIVGCVLLLSTTKGTVASADDVQNDNGNSPLVIRLVERIHDFAFVDAPPAGLSLGDRIIFTSDLFDQDGQQVGRDGADCVTVRIDPAAPPAEQQIVQCTITVQLPDGQITVQGMAAGTENLFAITGGTGAYRKARGEALAKDRAPLQVADITITLFR